MESVLIGNTEWILSVWWQDIKAKGRKDVQKKARVHYKKNAQIPYDAFCILESNDQFQAGYVERDKNLPIASQKALAALFAAKYKTCAIRLVFKTGVWVCGIGDGLVEPDSDFFGPPEEAERVFNEFYALREWDKVIEIDDPKEAAEAIRVLSEEIPKVAELRPVVRELDKKKLLLAAGILCSLAVVLLFFFTYLDRKEKAQMEADKVKKAAVLRKLDEQNYEQQVAQLQFKKVWEFEPSVQAVAQTCFSEMGYFPLVEKGWLLDTLVCTTSHIKAQWKRLDYGRFTDLPPNGVFDVDDPGAKQAISEWNRKMEAPTRDKGVPLLNRPDGAANLYQVAKDFQFAVTATWPKPEVRTIPARNPKDKPQTLVSPYSKCLWTLTGKYRPDDAMIRILTGLPGMMLNEVIHAYERGEWVIKGELYVL